MRLAALALVTVLAAGGPALALTEQELAQVGVDPPRGARLDLGLPARGAAGRPTTLAAAADGRPIVFLFAEYRCRYLCGPALSLTADALSRSGLAAGRDYRLVVVGLDPRDGPDAAAAFGAARLAGFPRVRAAADLLAAGAPTISQAARSLGYRYRYDRERDQFAHMATAFVLAPDGRLVEALSNFELQPAALAAALGRASDGEAPALVSRLHALCYPFDPARGIYDAAVRRSLQVAAAGLLAAGLFAAWRLRRRRTR